MSSTASHPWAPGSGSTKTGLNAVIDSKELNLSDLHKHYLHSRWLEQVLHMERETRRAVTRYYTFRLLTAIGSLLILVLVSLGSRGEQQQPWAVGTRYWTIGLCLLVCVSVVLEHLFDYNDRRRQYERKLERLKTEGWRFLELSGHYRRYTTHTEAFPMFTNQVEDLTQREVEVYMTGVEPEKAAEPIAVAATAKNAEAEHKIQFDIPLNGEDQPPTTRDALRDIVASRAHRQQLR